MLDCVLWCDQYSEALYLVKRSKGGGISLPPIVSETQSGRVDLSILHIEVIFFLSSWGLSVGGCSAARCSAGGGE